MTNRRKTLAGHRAFLKKALSEVDGVLENGTTRDILFKWKGTLRPQMEKIEPLDETILADMTADDRSTNNEIAKEFDESARRKAANTTHRLAAIDEKLEESVVVPVQRQASPFEQPDPSHSEPYSSVPSSSIPHQPMRARLPKLEVRKFNGRLQEWQGFWDSFSSAVHENQSLSKVDMFSYITCVDVSWNQLDQPLRVSFPRQHFMTQRWSICRKGTGKRVRNGNGKEGAKRNGKKGAKQVREKGCETGTGKRVRNGNGKKGAKRERKKGTKREREKGAKRVREKGCETGTGKRVRNGYGKKGANVRSVYNGRDTSRHQSFYDFIETKFRDLIRVTY